ncbi:SDR family oxidoreductase [Aliterella atlantica]|uniref:3-beta hydroxysteroid dehydrogenase n=1 Tax=Aliterella atlantica CENA595 TaxID=1618023 RepID=A0A0D8ZNR7_9CYAN|nr:SDR family oxidoreductase [Aliterella atlantica]KJH70458.1 3-beta hydroxysteroid dehydrogenase [Aliterella atlantica CENA595]
MQAFVTGSTGLLGNNLVRLLIEQGYKVKALVRSKAKAAKLFADLDISLVEGDMLDIDRFACELAGCDVLFHTAAYFREYFQPGNHWQMLEDINITGTMKLLSEAEKQGVKKVIYISSAGPVGMKANGVPGDESTPYDLEAAKNLYFKSKVVAETAIDKFLQQHSLPVVLILPGWMFGPQDAAPTNSGKLVLDYLAQKIPGIIDGGACMVDARDVAQAAINAVEKGKSGDRYIVAGQYLSMENLFKSLEKVTGVACPQRRIPYQATLVYAWLADMYARLTGAKSVLPLEGVRTMHRKRQVTSAKAIAELAASFRPLDETLGDVVNWYLNSDQIIRNS